MTTIELLENRIAELEKCIYGLKGSNGNDKAPSENPVIDNLLHANTLISSAMSGRVTINAAAKRLPELNSYMDLTTETVEIPVASKLELLLAMAPDIKKNCDMLRQLEELKPVLETDRIKDVPELSTKLNDLNLSYLKLCDENQELNGHINDLFAKYNEVMTSISKSLINMHEAVTAAEIAAVPKKVLD